MRHGTAHTDIVLMNGSCDTGKAEKELHNALTRDETHNNVSANLLKAGLWTLISGKIDLSEKETRFNVNP